MPTAAKPKSLLGFYRLLSPTSSVKVSPLCLGAMNFGEAWKGYMGECDKKTSFDMLDYFFQNGGNFIDTANNYQDGQSEQWVGEWMESRGNRDQMVVATKYTNSFRVGAPEEIQSNFAGNGTKSMNLSLKASLKKLKTDYIDLLYVHWWDFTTSIPELMQSLNSLVVSGQVLYLGISDAPAWVVSQANEYARQNHLRPFSVYQGRWSAASRDFERDIIPMCQANGMALAPWGALGGGYFKSEAAREQDTGRKIPDHDTEAHRIVSGVLEKIANSKNTAITSVALAYVMHKAPYVFPIVGGRKIEHLKANVEALSLQLSADEMKEIEDVVPFDYGFPHSLIGGVNGAKNPQDVELSKRYGVYDWVEPSKPIQPHGLE